MRSCSRTAHRRKLHPQRHDSDGQLDAERRIAVGRKCPIQRRTHIVEMRLIKGLPLGLRMCHSASAAPKKVDSIRRGGVRFG